MSDQNEKTAVQTAIEQSVQGGFKELVIRTGEALPLREPKAEQLLGQLDTPRRVLSKRKLDYTKAILMINRNDRKILLRLDPHNHYGSDYIGQLTLNPQLEKFYINTDKCWQPEDLGNFIRMHRLCFDSWEQAVKLATQLKNFEAKVQREMEKKNDDRGNTRNLKSQAVESNLPESFVLKMPLFQGEHEATFKVEVNIHPSTLECNLISPDLNDQLEQWTHECIDRELEVIGEDHTDLLIVEI